MTSRARRRPRSAFVLVQILIVLGLLTFFALAATRVFRLAVRTSSSAATQQDELVRLDQALARLRADAWQAKAITVENPATLNVTAPDGAPITWATDKDGDLVRTQGDDRQRWTDLKLSFESQPPFVTVCRGDDELALLRRATGGRP